MKKLLSLISTLIIICLCGKQVLAAPKTMTDEQIFDAQFYAETYLDGQECWMPY